MEAKGSLTCSHGCATGPWSASDETSPHCYFLEIRFNNIVTSTLACHVVFRLSFRVKIYYAFSISLMPELFFKL
jgi:hypothetical protein